MANELEQLVLSKAQKWLDGDYDEATKKQVRYLMDHDRKELTESFYKDLEFGTGGLRGIMGVGTNRMNVYTVGMATQGLANYLKKEFRGRADPRGDRPRFAQQFADVRRACGRHLRFERIYGLSVRQAAPHSRVEFRHPRTEMPFGGRGHRFAQSQGVQRLQGLLDGRFAGNGPARPQHHRRGGEDHLDRPDPHGCQSGQHHAAGRGVRRDLLK